MGMSEEREACRREAVPEDFYERIKQEVQKRIAAKLRFAGRVVDLGCGSCELDRFLACENRQHVIGVDISGGSFPEEGAAQGRIECRKADARRLEFIQDHSVDVPVHERLHRLETGFKFFDFGFLAQANGNDANCAHCALALGCAAACTAVIR